MESDWPAHSNTRAGSVTSTFPVQPLGIRSVPATYLNSDSWCGRAQAYGASSPTRAVRSAAVFAVENFFIELSYVAFGNLPRQSRTFQMAFQCFAALTASIHRQAARLDPNRDIPRNGN